MRKTPMWAGRSALLVAVVLIARGLVERVEVSGASMAPTFAPGDRLLVWKRFARLCLRVGDVVVVADPRSPSRALVKRVAAVGTQRIVVRGDNPSASTDSRGFGPVPPAAISGRVFWRYFPADAAGRVGRQFPSG